VGTRDFTALGAQRLWPVTGELNQAVAELGERIGHGVQSQRC